MKIPLNLIGMSLLVLSLNGCKTPDTILSDSGVYRAGSDVYGHIASRNENGQWQVSKSKVHIPEGMFIAKIDNTESKILTSPTKKSYKLQIISGISVAVLFI